MKHKLLPLMLSACLLLTACSGGAADADDTAAPDTADAADTGDSAADDGETEDPYAYLADFDYSSGFDDNGYIVNVVAGDYVTLPEDFASLTLPAGSDEVSAEDIEAFINSNYLADFATTEQITDRAAEMGDAVNIDFVGSVDGVEFEGGNSGGSGYDITLGSNTFIDDFEEQIAGHEPGETFDVEVTFPDPYSNNPDLAGKDAVFVTTLHYISEEKLPELTDDFVKENLSEDTGFKTVKELQAYAEEELLFERKADIVMGLLYENTQFADPMPEDFAQYFKDWTLVSAYQYAMMYGMDMTSFLQAQTGLDPEGYLEATQESTNSLMQQTLLMQAIAEKKGIVVDDETLEKNFEDIFGTDDMAGFEADVGRNYLRMNVLNNLVMRELINGAKVAAK